MNKLCKKDREERDCSRSMAPFTRVISSRDEFQPGMTWISSQDDFHLGVWSFTCKYVHDLEQKCVRPGMISYRS